MNTFLEIALILESEKKDFLGNRRKRNFSVASNFKVRMQTLLSKPFQY